jgi:hypothetical protein
MAFAASLPASRSGEADDGRAGLLAPAAVVVDGREVMRLCSCAISDPSEGAGLL